MASACWYMETRSILHLCVEGCGRPSVEVSESVRCVRETTTRRGTRRRGRRDDDRDANERARTNDDDDDDDPARVRTRIGRERDADRVRFAEDDDDARARGPDQTIVVEGDADDECSGFTRQGGGGFIAVDAVDAVVGESERVVAGTTRAGESAARGDGARETGERGEVYGDEGRGRERDEEGRREIA